MSTSCEQNVEHTKNGSDVVDAVSSDIEKMNISTDNTSVCANCGREGNSNSMNICNKCKMVKYCNAACKKKHRKKHKKQCERRVAELHDEELFKQPPPLEDCPICFLRLPLLNTGKTYMPCCGKVICCGCIHAPVHDHEGNVIAEKTCPFCRTKFHRVDVERIEMMNKRVDLNDPVAMYNLGCFYFTGMLGLPRNYAKALELWHRAGELGSAEAYHSIGNAYAHGFGVEVDKKKATHYWELAAMGGDASARYKLGVIEARSGNMDRALNHFIVAVTDGYSDSLEGIKLMYENGDATKDDYAKALRSYQAYVGEVKSDQRDEAAAAKEEDKCYESIS